MIFFNSLSWITLVSFKQTRLDLSLYDTDNTGYLTEEVSFLFTYNSYNNV